MPFIDDQLGGPRPDRIRTVALPRRERYFPSPVDWRDEVLYFLLVDRFSDGGEAGRPLLDRAHRSLARPAPQGAATWRWDRWAQSGGDRWQGGTIAGVRSKLGYLKDLGISAIWLSPVFRQRAHLDSYHGYGIQDFLEVDPRFGTRQDLVDLVQAAHAEGLRIILDIIFNHSGPNWLYPGNAFQPPYLPPPGRYAFGAWLDGHGAPAGPPAGPDDGVWPEELQDVDRYTRAGSGSLGAGSIDDPDAEHKRTDFLTLRDFALDAPGTLTDLAACYKYWIALTDCDGFRIDTLKHVSLEQARNFCGTIKEFAENLGKQHFLLVGEIAGGDFAQDRYLDVLDRNLDAALDIGEMRLALNGLARGLIHPSPYFDGFDPGDARMGSHRNLGRRHVAVLDDHDHVFGPKVRFSADASVEHQVVAGVALLLFTLGIPCVYYGTEQALAGPEPGERHFLPDWGGSDRYLREAMFGPAHPRRAGRDGLPGAASPLDPELPGFGAFGTAGHHVFDASHPVYRRIAALAAVRRAFPVLRSGRQYARPTSIFDGPFAFRGPGEVVAWSRILDDEEAVCVVNVHGTDARGADVLVDASLNPPGSTLTVVAHSGQTGHPAGIAASHPIGSTAPVRRTPGGIAFVEVRNLPASEVLVLVNRA